MKTWIQTILLATATVALFAGPASAQQKVVNLYSHREPKLIEPLLEAFTKDTGIQTNVVFADKGMVERLKAEGANSPADLVLTVDAGRLNDLVEADLVQPIPSSVVKANTLASGRPSTRAPGSAAMPASSASVVSMVSRAMRR